MKKGLYYLATAYHGTEEEKAYRTEMSLNAATEFLRKGLHIFAPLIYVNQIAEELNLPYEDRRKVVINYLFDFLKVSTGMILVTVDGWEKSWGVRQELLFCLENQIPVYKITPDQIYSTPQEILSYPVDLDKELKQLEAA